MHVVEIETGALCRHLEAGRVRHPHLEKALLSSLAERGIEDPFYGTGQAGTSALLLLDGFKRLRCAEKLGIGTVPVCVLGEDAVPGMLHYLRLSAQGRLHPLEEAHLLEVLHQTHGLSLSEIADRLMRSVTWVRLRLHVLEAMSEAVKERIFAGAFPFRSWLYTLRARTRVHPPREVEAFVTQVSGHGLSTRDIELLGKAWFAGSELQRRQIEEGKLEWTLLQLRGKGSEGSAEGAASLLKDLDILCAVMKRAGDQLRALATEGKAFPEGVLPKVGGVLRQMEGFQGEFSGYGQGR